MTATTSAETYAFPKQLNLDRAKATYTFEESADTVLVVNAQEEVSLEELELLFHPYESREVSSLLEMFDQEVLKDIQKQKRQRAAELARQSRAEEASVPEDVDELDEEKVDGGEVDNRVPVTSGGRTLARDSEGLRGRD